MIYHSNKIENDRVTRDKVEKIKFKSKSDSKYDQEVDIEIKNLDHAYDWMLNNFDAVTDNISFFCQELNKQILADLPNSDNGAFRSVKVEMGSHVFLSQLTLDSIYL